MAELARMDASPRPPSAASEADHAVSAPALIPPNANPTIVTTPPPSPPSSYKPPAKDYYALDSLALEQEPRRQPTASQAAPDARQRELQLLEALVKEYRKMAEIARTAVEKGEKAKAREAIKGGEVLFESVVLWAAGSGRGDERRRK